MILITKKGNVYKWNYKRLLRHLFYIVMIVFFIVAFGITSHLDYMAMF